MPTSYPSNLRHTAGCVYEPTTKLDYNKKYNNTLNSLCYTYSKTNIYKPHSASGMIGTTAASHLARRRRI